MTKSEFDSEVWVVRELMLAALKRRLIADGTDGGAKLAPTELGAVNNFLKMNGAGAPEEQFQNLFGEDADDS